MPPRPPVPLQPSVAVAIYRGLLRSCGNGRHPEVFGPRASLAWVGVSTAADLKKQSIIPADPASVRSSIRKMLDLSALTSVVGIAEQGIEIPPPFDVLRDANSQSAILLPNIQALPAKLPIFDYEQALLPGEQTTFRFFEPRYKRLVEAATNDGGDGWFLLRMRLPYCSILLRITEHLTLPNGEYVVTACAGPRVSVLAEDSEGVASGAPQLAWAMEYEIKRDEQDGDTPEPHDDLYSMRQRCLDLLLGATSITNLASISMPPLDPEAFSLWVLRFVIGDDDMPARLKWLINRSTSRRLLYVIDLLERHKESRKGEKSNNVTN